MEDITQSKDFIHALDRWLYKNDQAFAQKLYTYKARVQSQFKTYNKPLYRGMKVDAKFLEASKSATGVKFDKFSSWSKEKDMALNFIDEEGYAVNRDKNSTIAILITKKFTPTDIILDIHSFANYVGYDTLKELGMDTGFSIGAAMNEKEVLINRNVKITMKDITFVS